MFDASTLQLIAEHVSTTYYAIGRSLFVASEAMAVGGEAVVIIMSSDFAATLFSVQPTYRGLDGSEFGRSVHFEADVLHVGSPFYSGGLGGVHQFSLPGFRGSSYCGPANLNSTGYSAIIAAYGPAHASCGILSLLASNLPSCKLGYFLASQSQGFSPFAGGSQGNLCLAGKVGRFSKQVQHSRLGGEFSVDVDLAALPPPLQSTVRSGETWNFQSWFRDVNPGPTSNFTDAVSVTFE